MRALEPWHFLILLLVILVLFGGRRLPDAARGLGRSMRIFKSEVKQMQDESPRPAARPAQPIEQPVEPPVEGRIVDGQQQQHRAATPGEPGRDV